ncbi:MAG: 2-oxo acid dehydrogenase subunit E2 [Ardenticatenaceae bacterium]|nr:2-oxo acid dehydrogenase subunit E2 [Ardenticatenaceae bacterium]
MNLKHDKHTTLPYPRERLLMVDGGRLARRKHTIHGMVEFDVTEVRESMRQHKMRTGEALSFTAFILSCLGKAIEMNRHMHAYRSWRNQLVIFDEVDVNTLFEVEVDGRKTIRPHILRGVNKKSFDELHREIRAFQQEHESSQEAKAIKWFVRLPGFVRRLFLRFMLKRPSLVKDLYGTVSMSSVGMFGSGGGWGIPVPNHTLQVTLGGIARKPGAVDDRVEIREYLSVTISFDHDIVDGAPAARFAQRFKELVESGSGLLV